jgi:hypothetical protein
MIFTEFGHCYFRNLSENQLSGSIPCEIGNLFDLTELYVKEIDKNDQHIDIINIY